MGSKVIICVGIFIATVLLISSEVAAGDLAETSNTLDTSTEKTTNGAGVEDAKYGGYPGGGYPGGGYPGGGYPGGRHPGGGYPGGGYPGGGYPGRGNCRYGCCGRSYYGGGCRCCAYAGEMPDAEP